MSLRFLSFTLLCGVSLSECSSMWWRGRELVPSSSVVFNFPSAASASNQSVALREAIQFYRANRGGEIRFSGPDNSKLHVVQLEWDQVETGPLMSIAAHFPEICNTAGGLTLVSLHPKRIYESALGGDLVFDVVEMADPSHNKVFVFKLPWIQGFGSWHLRERDNPIARLKASFIRHIGAARMLDAGVFGARDSCHAWTIFQSEVLEKLEWKEGVRSEK